MRRAGRAAGRPAGDPNYRRSQPARAKCRARAQRQAAAEAAEAGFAARAAGAMAHAGRGGVIVLGKDGLSTAKPIRNRSVGFASLNLPYNLPFQCPDSAACCHCSGSILEAMITAWVRLSTPSFCRIAETWAFTVASETPSA